MTDQNGTSSNSCITTIKYTVNSKVYNNTINDNIIRTTGDKLNIIVDPKTPSDFELNTVPYKLMSGASCAFGSCIVLLTGCIFFLTSQSKMFAAATGATDLLHDTGIIGGWNRNPVISKVITTGPTIHR